jgi:hypothetical protein
MRWFSATFFIVHLLMGTGFGEAIRGMVTDSSGAAMPGVPITVKGVAGGLPRSVITDETGKYYVPLLRPGTYVISADLAGFVAEPRVVVLSADGLVDIDFHLRILPTHDCAGCLMNIPAPEPTRFARTELSERIVGSIWNFSIRLPGVATGDGRPSADELRTRTILEQLHSLGQDALPALILGLQDRAVTLRQNAAFILLNLGGGFSAANQTKIDIRETLPALIAALDDSDAQVRGWSAQAIGQVGPDAAAAVAALIVLLSNADEGSRNSSCIALRRIGPSASAALPALQRALSDSSSDVRRFAELAIAAIQRK